MQIHIKRIYDEPSDDDGVRVLVDRLWPRGMTKDAAELDAWMKNLAPSPDLRREFNHQPERFTEFKKHYRAELKDRNDAIEELQSLLDGNMLTLLYAAKDPKCNHAIVLREFLKKRL